MGTLSLLKDVGITWFREEDYPVLLEIFDDAGKMPRAWKKSGSRGLSKWRSGPRPKDTAHSASISIPIVSRIGVCAKG
jgi:hypothetical protein